MQAVIFDMDGVIVDSEPIHAQHLEDFLLTIGVNQPELLQVSLKGVSARDTSAILIETFSLEYEVEELVTLSRQAYMDHLNSLEEIPSIPGAVMFIKYLAKSGYRLALASSASPMRINMFLTKLGIKSYFSVITSGDDVERSKPAPDIFLLTARRLGIQPGDCVVVEDAQNGVRAAKDAGMKCIAYGGSAHNTDDLLAADLVVKDFVALVKALKTGKLPV